MRADNRGTLLLLIPLVLVAVAVAQAETDSMAVERGVMAREVVDREPVDESDSFPADIGQVACFTRIVGADGEQTIYHVWKHAGEEKAKVELTVRGSSWRTWSTKRILPSWTGDWTVEIQDDQGNVLKKLDFTIVAPAGDMGMGR